MERLFAQEVRTLVLFSLQLEGKLLLFSGYSGLFSRQPQCVFKGLAFGFGPGFLQLTIGS